MNRQLQQMLGLWISYQNNNPAQKSKTEIIKQKEYNYGELLRICQNYLADVIDGQQSLEILYMAQKYQVIQKKAQDREWVKRQYMNKNNQNQVQKDRVLKILFVVYQQLYGKSIEFIKILEVLQPLIEGESSKDWIPIIKQVFARININKHSIAEL